MKKLLKQLNARLPALNWIKHVAELSKNQTIFLYGCLLFVILVGIGSLLFPRDRSSLYAEYQVGTVAPEQIISPATFEINKSIEEYEREKEQVRAEVASRFFRDSETENEAERNTLGFFNYLRQFIALSEEYNSLQNRVRSSQGQADTLLVRRINELESRSESLVKLLKRGNNIDIDHPNWFSVLQCHNQSLTNSSKHVLSS